MVYDSQIKFGTLILGGTGNNSITTIRRNQVPGSIKTKDGSGTWVITPIPGRSKDVRIEITGNLKGTNRDADRATLKGYENDVRRLEDGIDNGDYIIIPDTLIFHDDARNKTVYEYSMVLLAWNQ